MEQFKIGDRVAVTVAALSVSYIAARRSYTDLRVGKTGTVIALSVGMYQKIGIEFDTPVFINYTFHQSSHDNGCNGKGKLHHCWYIPFDCLEKIPVTSIEEVKHISSSMQQFLDNMHNIAIVDEEAKVRSYLNAQDNFLKHKPIPTISKAVSPASLDGTKCEFPWMIEECGPISSTQAYLDVINKQNKRTLHEIHGFKSANPYKWDVITSKSGSINGISPYEQYLAELQLNEDYYITLL